MYQQVSAGPTPQTLLNLFLQEPADVVLLLRMTIKCADLSHFAKTLPLHKRWNDLVLQGNCHVQIWLMFDSWLNVSFVCCLASQSSGVKAIASRRWRWTYRRSAIVATV
jgi:hypothetical protein